MLRFSIPRLDSPEDRIGQQAWMVASSLYVAFQSSLPALVYLDDNSLDSIDVLCSHRYHREQRRGTNERKREEGRLSMRLREANTYATTVIHN